ncbi:uncharacterized protein LOC126986008 [Eriocheir sinensis]|uniref:uncharacterized protein LOC126986008 n=1 Tax=Eriocheir sinensis TaxID=95602 RepID=UPI0021C9AD63|nr:uncharacterized protein LOC126986008 [Eriocheir sinensis]
MDHRDGPSTPFSPPAGWGEQTPLKSFSLMQAPRRRGATLIVPESPTNTPTFTVPTPEVTEVMETPDGLEETCGGAGDVILGAMGSVGKPGVGTGALITTKPRKPKSQGLFKLRRQSLVSLLESEFAQKPQELEGSSDTAGETSECNIMTPRRKQQWSRVHSALGTDGKGHRSRSLANVILPFDLNDEECLAAKLGNIQHKEERKGGKTTPTHSRRRTSATPTSTDSPGATTRCPRMTRTTRHHSSGVRRGHRPLPVTPNTASSSSSSRQDGARSPVTPKVLNNGTIYFTNEDLLMTPVNHGRVLGPREDGKDNHTPSCHTPRRAMGDATHHAHILTSPKPHPARPDLTPQHSDLPKDLPLDIRKKLKMVKSPLLLVKKFDATTTQRLTEILTGGLPGRKRTETREQEGGEGDGHSSILLSTPTRKPAVGGRVAVGAVSPCKDPSAVLKGVVAYVEVRVERDNRSAVIREQLKALGAQVDIRLTRNTTHVIFREGSMSVFLRARERGLHILSSLWVEACRVSQSHAPEGLYPSTSMETYSSGLHITKKKRPKSMQPRDFSDEAGMRGAAEKLPPGFCTPRHRVVKKDINSPLFGIGHLLSPRYKVNGNSTCEEEEEEEEEESESEDICTPLAQRLYRRYMSGQKGGRRIAEEKEEEEEEGEGPGRREKEEEEEGEGPGRREKEEEEEGEGPGRREKEEEEEGEGPGRREKEEEEARRTDKEERENEKETSCDAVSHRKRNEDDFHISDDGSIKLHLDGSDSSSQRPSVEVVNEGESATLQHQRLASTTSHESRPRKEEDPAESDESKSSPSLELNVESILMRLGTEGQEGESEKGDSPKRLITARNNTRVTTTTTTTTTTPGKRKRERRGRGEGEPHIQPLHMQPHPSTTTNNNSTTPVKRKRERGSGEGEPHIQPLHMQPHTTTTTTNSTTPMKRKREREDPQPHPSTSSTSSSIDIPLRRQSLRLASRPQDSPGDILRGLGSQNSPPEDRVQKRRKYDNSPECKTAVGRNETHPESGTRTEEAGMSSGSSSRLREDTGEAGGSSSTREEVSSVNSWGISDRKQKTSPARMEAGRKAGISSSSREVSRVNSWGMSKGKQKTSPTGMEAGWKAGISSSSREVSSVNSWDMSKGKQKTSPTEEVKGREVEIPASQRDFPLLSQGFGTQRGRRRLMCLDEDVTPSQDLIQPSTPNPKDRRNGPYTDILHPPPKKARTRCHNRELFTQTTSPNAQTESQRGEPSSRVRSGESEGQVVTSTVGEDNVFVEPRLELLPRPRRSTEEFKMGCAGRPVPKKGARRNGQRRVSGPSSFLCLTSLHSSDKRTVIPIIRKLGRFKVGEGVDHRTSHVVCGEERRTLNLLLAIARGCWVVDVSWVYRSLEGREWAPEEPFELGTFAPAAKVCRKQRQAQGSSYRHTLFSGVGRVCVLDGCTPPSAQLKELLELCGASLVSRVRSARVVIGSGPMSPGTRHKTTHSSLVTHVSEKWVLDSIQHHRIHPLQDYLVS